MICFEVRRNGELLCRAGIGDDGVLSAILSGVFRVAESGKAERDLHLHVGGLHHPEPGAHVHPSWVELDDLGPGDEVTVRVVEAAAADPPARSSRQTEADVREQQRRYYERIKAQLEGESG